MKSEITSSSSQTESHKSSTLRRLGVFNALVLHGGTLANIGCIILLAFLWFGNEDNQIWRTIVVQSWATRYVAIISLVIRVVTSAQSVQCVSMLSSLVLEEFETPLSSVAAVSILRFKNGGVFDLAFFHFLFQGRPTSKKVALGFATLLLFVTLSGLQFTSTALLSDMSFRNITIQQPEESIAYTHLEAYPPTQTIGFLARDPFFPTFVEHTAPPQDLAEGLFDTGTVMRGFIPAYESTQREKIVRYSGMATFYDHRVVCVRPSEKLTHLTATYGAEEYEDGSLNPIMNLTGFTDTDLAVSRFNGSRGGTFDCGALLTSLFWRRDPVDERQAEWHIGLCSFDNSDGGLISAMQDTPLSPWYELVNTITVGRDKYVVVNMTSFPELSQPPTSFNLTSTGSIGEWLSFTGAGPFEEFKLSLSLCYTAGAGQHRRVDVVRPSGGPTEPRAIWEPPKYTALSQVATPYTEGWYETRSIREQVNGVPGNLPPNPRNIFIIVDPPKSWISFSNNSSYTGQGPVVAGSDGLSYELFYDGVGFNPQHSLCVTCDLSVRTGNIHGVYLLVTNQIIRETTHPGLGIQALLTFYWAQNYYSEAYKFGEYANGTYWTTISVLAPDQTLFFPLIITALIVEMLLMACITIVFVKGTRYSLLGNSWQALSQVTGESVDRWMVNGSTMADTEIEAEMKSVGCDRALVGLVDSGDSRDRIRFRRGLVFSEPRGMAP